MRYGELLGALADQEDVIGSSHHLEGDLGRVANLLNGRDGTGGVGGTVHHGGVEGYDASFIGEPAQPDGHIVRVILDERDARDYGVDRVGALFDLRQGPLDGRQPVARGDDPGAGGEVARRLLSSALRDRGPRPRRR